MRNIYIISNCFLLLSLAVLFDSVRVFLFYQDILLISVYVVVIHNILLTLGLCLVRKYIKLVTIYSTFITVGSCMVLLYTPLSDPDVGGFYNPIALIILPLTIFIFGSFVVSMRYNFILYISISFLIIGLVYYTFSHIVNDSGLDEVVFVEEFIGDIRDDIEFVDKPNIYAVSFDGLTARSLLYEMTNIQDSEFHDIIDTNFSVYSPSFSNAHTTGESFTSLLTLGLKDFRYPDDKLDFKYYFSGNRSSPVFDILRDNKYQIHTVYSSHLLGTDGGPYVDGFHLTHAVTNFCARVEPFSIMQSFTGYFYCDTVDGIELLVNFLTNGFGEAEHRKQLRLSDRLIISKIEEIHRESSKNSPLFIMTHFNVPLHTPGYYDRENKEHYDSFVKITEKNMRDASVYLNEVIEFIRNDDPNALLFVYGDHGLLRDTKNETYDSHPDYVMKSRYGNLAAIYPKKKCYPEMQSVIDDKGYLTLVDAYHAILRCLSQKSTIYTEQGMDSVGNLDKPIDWYFNLDRQLHMKKNKDETLHYKDFLYPYEIED